MSRVLLLAIFAAVVSPRTARATSCPPSCRPLLCSAVSTVVSGTLQPDPGDPQRRVLVVDAVLRLAEGARAPQRGARLPSWSGTTATSGPVVGYYEGADLSIPMGIFPVGADGNVHCRGWGESSSAPEGKGVTPARLAELSAHMDCGPELAKAGYTIESCDDGGPCAMGKGRPSLPLVLLSIAVAVRLARSRPRGRSLTRPS